LRLAQGHAEVADATIRRVVAETQVSGLRAERLAAFVDIVLTVGDTDAARPAASELTEIAAQLQSPYLEAAAGYAVGAVELADGNASVAIKSLRQAWTTFCDVDAPYDAARARMLIGLACREVGDIDTATMEFDAARRVFVELGAAPDIERLDRLTGVASQPGGLTGREVEVLALLAAGKTNRQIGDALFISEKTVARHVSNIFTKLGVSSRAAATGYAFKHGLA
jgi:DNA-binding CsgD family transcriptional regulator